MKTREITDRLHDWRGRAGETVRTMGLTTDRYVRDYAWTGLAVAVALGCVIGLLIGKRRD